MRRQCLLNQLNTIIKNCSTNMFRKNNEQLNKLTRLTQDHSDDYKY